MLIPLLLNFEFTTQYSKYTRLCSISFKQIITYLGQLVYTYFYFCYRYCMFYYILYIKIVKMLKYVLFFYSSTKYLHFVTRVSFERRTIPRVEFTRLRVSKKNGVIEVLYMIKIIYIFYQFFSYSLLIILLLNLFSYVRGECNNIFFFTLLLFIVDDSITFWSLRKG